MEEMFKGASFRIDETLERALALAGANRESFVTVAGPDGLVAMLALFRMGWARAQFAATGAAALEASEVVLVLGDLEGESLSRTIGDVAHLLRRGGELVVALRDRRDRTLALDALAATGRAPLFTRSDPSGRLIALLGVGRRPALRQAG